MPATSRSGERLRRRSSSGRPGSPSKSSTIQPAGPVDGLAEVVVAVHADQTPTDAGVRQRLQVVAQLLAAPGDRRERRVVLGKVDEQSLDLLVKVARQQRDVLAGGSAGAKSGSLESDASVVCIRPVTAPSSRRRSR